MIRAFYDESDVVTRLSTCQSKRNNFGSNWPGRFDCAGSVRWWDEFSKSVEAAKREDSVWRDLDFGETWRSRIFTTAHCWQVERVWRQIQEVQDLFWTPIFFFERVRNEGIEGTEGKQMRFERWDRVLWPDFAGVEESSIEERDCGGGEIKEKGGLEMEKSRVVVRDEEKCNQALKPHR